MPKGLFFGTAERKSYRNRSTPEQTFLHTKDPAL
jgi:hypothetical protein